jgi:hypothetical protein
MPLPDVAVRIVETEHGQPTPQGEIDEGSSARRS